METAGVPLTKTATERNREWRRRNPDESKRQRTEYRRKNSKWQTDASYLSKPFIAWDGEGISLKDGSHIYVMLAVKGEGVEDYTFNPKGLDTIDCFESVLRNANQTWGIHVIYGGNYDWNMWLGDVPKDKLERAYRGAYVDWNGYRFAWRQGKSFYLARVNEDGQAYEGVTMYDVGSFFQTAFVNACDSYLGENFYRRDIVVKNKALRSSFTMADVPDMREYNDIELTNLIRLMVELRERLNKCGLRPSRWDGPGAVASALLKRERIKNGMALSPDAVATAARHAYAGGRFEVLQFGSVNETVYEYDINSAYPAALLRVPNLNNGEWRYRSGDPGEHRFALYHVEYAGNDSSIPGALFRRDDNGTICYPMNVTGWYWSPEIETAREYCERGNGTMRVIEAWVFEERTEERPFAFIDRLYRMRQVYKAQGDGAHVGIKLGLNSLYGKTAQQVGARQLPTGEWRLPPFHQIEWAGYATSYCRGNILRACLDNLADVIAFETDAVFVSSRLPVPLTSELGAFEETVFDSLTYLQSGTYFGTSEGKTVERTRGIDKGQIHNADAQAALTMPRAEDRYITAGLTRFHGLGIALSQGMHKWRRWERLTKRVSVEPTGKRAHVDCDCGVGRGRGIELGRWHRTACPMLNDAHSAEFPVLWLNPDKAMAILAELRDTPGDWG